MIGLNVVGLWDTLYPPLSTWHVGHQPVDVLLAVQEADALVQDHDGVKLPGLRGPHDLGPVLHLAGEHGVPHTGAEPGPPDGGRLPGHRGQLGGNHLISIH